MKIIICGGGVIGSSIAYHLSQHPKASQGGEYTAEILVLESVGVACAASGKAGGFLARDWCDTQTIGPLARKSFEIHELLAKNLEGKTKYGFRRLDTFELTINSKPSSSSSSSSDSSSKSPDAWLDGSRVDLKGKRRMGSLTTTAQVHPFLFTKTLMEAAEETGLVKVRLGATVSSLAYDDTNSLIGVQLHGGEVIKADMVVLALGPWSHSIALSDSSSGTEPTSSSSSSSSSSSTPKKQKHPKQDHFTSPSSATHLPVVGQRAHSVILHPRSPIPPTALFLSYHSHTPFKYELTPEIYPRPDGKVYLCIGDAELDPILNALTPSSSPSVSSSASAVPANAAEITPEARRSAFLLEIARNVSSALDVEKAEIEQACFLPVCSIDNQPLIGRLDLSSPSSSTTKVFVATGHSCWGILNAPATGAAMAELIMEGQSSIVDLSPFNPNRIFKNYKH